MGDARHVDAAGSHVCGHQHLGRATTELLQRPLTLRLVEVAVDGGSVEAPIDQLVGQPLRRALGAGEDHHLADRWCLCQLADDLRLVQVVGLVDELGGVGDGRLGVVALGAHVHRLVQVRPSQRDDLCRHGGTEHQRLLVGRRHAGQPLYVGEEAEVEHFVGLVEHQHLHMGQVKALPVRQVEQSSGGADHDIDAVTQRVELLVVADAAIDRQDADLKLRRGLRQVGTHLQGQLASRCHHQRLRLAVVGEIVKIFVAWQHQPL